MKAGDRADCVKCGALATNITPTKSHDSSMAVFGCSACGYAFKADGGAFVPDATKLRDVFRGGTMAQKTVVEVMAGETMNAATKALFTAKLLEYGLQMWYDGVKQGILLGAIQDEYANKANQKS